MTRLSMLAISSVPIEAALASGALEEQTMLLYFKSLALAALLLLSSPVAFPAPVEAQGIGHTYFMRGSVVDVTRGVVTICIGRADGARAGQILSVVRVTSVGAATRPMSFRRKNVGSLEITEIIDDHFAHATIISGRIAKNDLVELRRK